MRRESRPLHCVRSSPVLTTCLLLTAGATLSYGVGGFDHAPGLENPSHLRGEGGAAGLCVLN